ncbi:MAG TPA: ATP-binding protein [Chloroflexia bacterium]|nr:ATP-binding protein [Chloroflexia bacterium]
MIDGIGQFLSEILTPAFLVDWATMAVSLFNVIVLLWLGLTVVLNAETPRWGVWLAGGGLILGGLFFVAHTAMLGHGLDDVGAGMDFWWQAGWIPVVILPYVWYGVMLWYSGFWDGHNGAVRRRHLLPFTLASLMLAGLAVLFVFFNPLPSYAELVQLSTHPIRVGLTRLQVLVVFYPVYAILCMGLSLDVVMRPEPSGRVMGDLARRRARPWLTATSVVLLAVGVLVAWVIIWLVLGVHNNTLAPVSTDLESPVYWFDLVTSLLVAIAICLLGQAIVSYEIFTGKILPRRGFVRQWRSALLLAVVYSLLVGGSLARQPHPVAGQSGLLLTTVLMSTFFALFSWRAYVERERYIDNLRPFVTSQGLFDELLARTGDDRPLSGNGAGATYKLGIATYADRHDVQNQQGEHGELPTPHIAFAALCHNVLGVRVGYLMAVGPLSPLVGPPLAYPAGREVSLPSISEITNKLESPQTMYVPMNPERWGGASWAVPLWSERGLIGVLLLGEKLDGGLYAQEEIEIARATGERLIDTQASAQLAQRLMHLQRQRLAESQVLDRRARRVLHDDVLPLLHTALLELMTEEGSVKSAGRRPKAAQTGVIDADDSRQAALGNLSQAHHLISDLLRDMPSTAAPEIGRLGLVGALRKVVNEEFATAFDSVEWQVDAQAQERASDISPLSAEVLYYAAREAIRNSARYARHNAHGEQGRPLHLKIAVLWHDGLEIVVEDDGAGIAGGRHVPDNSDGTNGSGPHSGSGQGLALHSTMMAVVGGSLGVESAPGEYTRVALSLPMGVDTSA